MFLEQLVYFGDLLRFDIMPATKAVPNREEVKQFFEDLVRAYVA